MKICPYALSGLLAGCEGKFSLLEDARYLAIQAKEGELDMDCEEYATEHGFFQTSGQDLTDMAYLLLCQEDSCGKYNTCANME